MPLSQRSTVRPGRRADGEGPPLRGKFGPPRGPGKFRTSVPNCGCFWKTPAATATGVPIVSRGACGVRCCSGRGDRNEEKPAGT